MRLATRPVFDEAPEAPHYDLDVDLDVDIRWVDAFIRCGIIVDIKATFVGFCVVEHLFDGRGHLFYVVFLSRRHGFLVIEELRHRTNDLGLRGSLAALLGELRRSLTLIHAAFRTEGRLLKEVVELRPARVANPLVTELRVLRPGRQNRFFPFGLLLFALLGLGLGFALLRGLGVGRRRCSFFPDTDYRTPASPLFACLSVCVICVGLVHPVPTDRIFEETGGSAQLGRCTRNIVRS